MRGAFVEELCRVAASDERVMLVCGDLGYSVLEVFAERFPNRYLNAGVSEQNMTGVAAGLALAGHVVVTYSIANFPVMRCFEQIRNDICYHGLDVKIVAVGGGLAYGPQGYSHHGVEDLAVMRVLPGMSVFAPGDPCETRLTTRAALSIPGPCYLRLGKAGEPAVHVNEPAFEVGRAIAMRDGADVTLVSTGGMLATVMETASALAQRGIDAMVLSMPCLEPFDTEAITRAMDRTGLVITVEEHGAGGLGSLAAEVIAQTGKGGRFIPARLPRVAISVAGDQAKLRAGHGLDVDGLTSMVMEAIART